MLPGSFGGRGLNRYDYKKPPIFAHVLIMLLTIKRECFFGGLPSACTDFQRVRPKFGAQSNGGKLNCKEHSGRPQCTSAHHTSLSLLPSSSTVGDDDKGSGCGRGDLKIPRGHGKCISAFNVRGVCRMSKAASGVQRSSIHRKNQPPVP